MIATPPPPPAIVIVQDAVTRQPTFFFGFMAVGEEKAMRALERAAEGHKFPAGRTTNDRNQPEVMVLFPVGSDQQRALALYRDALSGRFGPLALEVTIAPWAASADGKIDMETEVTVEPSATIVVPKR